MLSSIKNKISSGIAIAVVCAISMFAYSYYNSNVKIAKELELTKSNLVAEKKITEVLLIDLSNALEVNETNKKIIEELTIEVQKTKDAIEEIDRENTNNKKKFEEAKKKIEDIDDNSNCVSPVIKAAIIEIQKIRSEK